MNGALRRFASRWTGCHRLLGLLLVAGLAAGCALADEARLPAETAEETIDETADRTADRKDRTVETLRETMVTAQIEARGVRDERVLAAMRAVPRHRFAPDVAEEDAYQDHPHPIGHGQTISQPYIVALMTELAQLPAPPCKVLEVGTGSGYQAAVLAELGCEVFTVEIVEELAENARKALEATGYADRVHVRHGDGYRGWPEAAPFDAVLVTAAAPRVPEPLVDQLAPGGRLVIPVGDDWWGEWLEVHHRSESGELELERNIPVRFVPMVGEVRE